ncbi:Protein DMR6-like oxygenase 2 [Vitis vinifera]|uniref:Protein DMR6-like oxygenase 2 n=1 Tax=Vitis vinifera TaxID=29760 RepID=A0A438EPU8_VITVI|nr:Protein DMR6-like oxygenase 2 [Vitis vinifera]
MGEVDPAFIQDTQHRPELAVIEAEGIPLIDLSSANASNHVSQIADACKNWGFFQVINHGVPSESRWKIEDAARKFFALPLEEKRKVSRDEVNPLGYFDTEHTKNVRDWKEVFDFVVPTPAFLPASPDPDDKELNELTNQWPQYPPELREVCEEYAREMEKLAFKLLGLISLSLGLPENRFNLLFEESTNFIRLNHYPPCPIPHLALGVGRHKDSRALTILAQDDVGGLEVKRKTNGEWVRVKPTPDAYIINVGDIIQVWSNDTYESVEHRVTVNSQRERFSIPVFFSPGHHVWVKPLEELTKGEKPKYRAYNWGKFFAARRRSNFKKLDVENLQISHFKIEVSSVTKPTPKYLQPATGKERSMQARKKHMILVSFLIFLVSSVYPMASEGRQANTVKHFFLVHGSCHGAWSWYKIVALLKSSGHKPLKDFMESLPADERVVLVGHSLGGLAISQAMEKFPEKSLRRQGPLLDSQFTYDNGPNNPPTTFSFGPLFLSLNVYQLSPTEDLALGTVLMRPVRLFSEEDMSNELMLSKKYASVKRVFIISEEDKLGKKDFQLWMIEKNPPDAVKEIKGSDHMVMMSKPKDLWVHLQAIAEKYS